MGEGYLVDGLFVLNTIAFASNNNFSTGCAYIVESVNLCVLILIREPAG